MKPNGIHELHEHDQYFWLIFTDNTSFGSTVERHIHSLELPHIISVSDESKAVLVEVVRRRRHYGLEIIRRALCESNQNLKFNDHCV